VPFADRYLCSRDRDDLAQRRGYAHAPRIDRAFDQLTCSTESLSRCCCAGTWESSFWFRGVVGCLLAERNGKLNRKGVNKN
jgi:hypothetical protein